MQLLISMTGDEQTRHTLERFVDRLEDVSPALEQIATDIAGFETRQFNSEGKFGSGRWSPLSPRYRAYKQKRFPSKGILEATGALRESLTNRPFGVERIQSLEMTVGTSVPYAGYHQSGTDRMPQRRPLEFPESTRDGFVKTLQRFLVDGTVVPNPDAR